MKRKEYRILAVLLGLLLMTACAPSRPTHYQDPKIDLVAHLKAASRILLRDAQRFDLDRSRPILTTTLVNIDNLQQSSTFGRQATEVFGSEMSRAGHPIVELKLRDNIFIEEGTGELALSRELHHLSQSHDAQAVLAGTYAVGGNTLYVNVRLIQTTDNLVLGAHNFSLPLNRDLRFLLTQR